MYVRIWRRLIFDFSDDLRIYIYKVISLQFDIFYQLNGLEGGLSIGVRTVIKSEGTRKLSFLLELKF